MEPDNRSQIEHMSMTGRFDTKELDGDLSNRVFIEMLTQLAGIHDALIRLEATLRMIGVQMQERPNLAVKTEPK